MVKEGINTEIKESIQRSTGKGVEEIAYTLAPCKEKYKQEMIRQGLIEPRKPKLKMNNLMKVLGVEVTQDLTKLEMKIHSVVVEREQAHVDRNIT